MYLVNVFVSKTIKLTRRLTFLLFKIIFLTKSIKSDFNEYLASLLFEVFKAELLKINVWLGFVCKFNLKCRQLAN